LLDDKSAKSKKTKSKAPVLKGAKKTEQRARSPSAGLKRLPKEALKDVRKPKANAL
jgi:hypothetical protein